MKTIKKISLIVFISSTVFFGVWAYISDLTFHEFGTYFGIIGSGASIIGLFISIYALAKSKNEQNKSISVKKNFIENSTFGNIKGSINIGDNTNNIDKDL